MTWANKLTWAKVIWAKVIWAKVIWVKIQAIKASPPSPNNRMNRIHPQNCHLKASRPLSMTGWNCREAATAEGTTKKARRRAWSSVALSCLMFAYSDLSIFQKIGVAGPSSTPEIDFRQALGAKYCPSGM
jgi:hypothetical protein